MDHGYVPRVICRHAILYDTVEPPQPIKRDDTVQGTLAFQTGKMPMIAKDPSQR